MSKKLTLPQFLYLKKLNEQGWMPIGEKTQSQMALTARGYVKTSWKYVGSSRVPRMVIVITVGGAKAYNRTLAAVML